MKEVISKGCCGCLTASVALFILTFLFGIASLWIWPEAWGFKDLGNGLCLEDAEGFPVLAKGSFYSQGVYDLIPLVENRCNDQGTEYVVDTRVSDDWIIVKTRRRKKHEAPSESNEIKYYILDKRFDKDTPVDSISAHYVTCYGDSVSFVNACRERGVDVSW